ncbi:uncharacterized protein N0V89_011033 [Didymosphaeria variabile]|uniref:Major facilitator superfamily (MFS) profile domain-containing protein n=1 Tax=Didymosphaeria variabile TaxID=1932322 RepID=A0A9W8XCC5_9PLEO|nr:uncharacterized protein N0V89_011033 [Didymosphaeria variabile]KAJ4347096.1 hypothetical protein N0V89_011033 [Didymosphaeria variabile]
MSRSSTSIELEPYASTPIAPTQPSSVHTKGDDAPPAVDDLQPINSVTSTALQAPTKGTTAIVLVTVVCVTMISTLLAGLVTVGLPTMAAELEIPPSLLLWPISIYALACGCTLLLLGSVADVVGSRPMYLTGCVLQSAFTLACGLAQTSTQLIVFRALAGVAISFCLPSAVSIITSTFPEGKSRNVAFASMGGGQPIGFSVGLTLGGVFSTTIGWRWGFHIAAIINTVVFVIGLFGLPKVDVAQKDVWKRLRTEIDWVGIAIGAASLAMLSYSFALISDSGASIKQPATLSMLVISLALIPLFIFWVGRQERLGRPAVIPNSLWRNRIFTTICIGVFMTWGVFNAIESFLTLFFQDVQEISAIQTSVRFLPEPFTGALANIIMGLLAHKIRADWAVVFAVAMTAIALSPIGADAMFTVSNLVITSVFPAKTQALAGGVFNTIAQIGKSVGLATSGVIAASVTDNSKWADKQSPQALMEGYRAAFWYTFAGSVGTALLFSWGLRGIGRVGMKRE